LAVGVQSSSVERAEAATANLIGDGDKAGRNSSYGSVLEASAAVI
jgi:hypothetical protein